jgi:hypothetical protein
MTGPGRRYSVDGEQNIASPTVSCLGVTSASTVRPGIYFVMIGISGTPADSAVTHYIQRHTAAGTVTSVTPVPLDSGDPAALAQSGENHTIEPTLTANLIVFRLALNQRASHSWWADPYGALCLPATAANGLTHYPVHASSTVLVDVTMHYFE